LILFVIVAIHTGCDDEGGGRNAQYRPTEQTAADAVEANDTTSSTQADLDNVSDMTAAADTVGISDGLDPQQLGQSLYLGYCASCHGLDGAGTLLAPQVLNPIVGYASYVVRAGRDDMPEFTGAMQSFSPDLLAEADLDAIIGWLREAQKPTRGEALYVRFCGNCHGVDARSGRVDEDIASEAAEEPEEIFEAIREGHGGLRYGDREEFMPSWSSPELTDEEVALIAAYLATFPQDEEDEEDEEDDEEEDDD
jgi:mono/diheme cytochrome c family protein